MNLRSSAAKQHRPLMGVNIEKINNGSDDATQKLTILTRLHPFRRASNDD